MNVQQTISIKQHKHSFCTVTFYVWHESSAEGDGGNM